MAGVVVLSIDSEDERVGCAARKGTVLNPARGWIGWRIRLDVCAWVAVTVKPTVRSMSTDFKNLGVAGILDIIYRSRKRLFCFKIKLLFPKNRKYGLRYLTRFPAADVSVYTS